MPQGSNSYENHCGAWGVHATLGTLGRWLPAMKMTGTAGSTAASSSPPGCYWPGSRPAPVAATARRLGTQWRPTDRNVSRTCSGTTIQASLSLRLQNIALDTPLGNFVRFRRGVRMDDRAQRQGGRARSPATVTRWSHITPWPRSRGCGG